MGNNTEKNSRSKDAFVQTFKRYLSHLFLHNGGFKLLAVLISIIFWAGLISQDETLTRDKTFYDIPVSISGTDILKRNGFIVISDLGELLSDVNAVAEVPQQKYDSAEVSAYNIRVDLSRINGTGEQELKLLSTPSSTYGRITGINPSSVSVDVEDYVTRYRIPVSLTLTGETPAGWYISTPSIDPPLIVVSGPKSLVNDISRARVFLNPNEVEWVEGASVTTAKLTLFNRSGSEINDSLLEISYEGVSLDSVVLEYTVLPTRTFEISDIIGTLNSVADGYEVQAIHVSPENITVAARQEVLDQITELALSERYVDLSGLSETTSFQIRISKPSDDAVLSNDTVTVTVEIGPVSN